MAEVEIEGNSYSIGKLTPKQQWNVVRRLTPLLAGSSDLLREAAAQLPADQTGEDGIVTPAPVDQAALWKAFVPFADAISGMKDADSDFIIDTALSVCGRKSGERWANLMMGTNLMFQDLTMSAMLKLTFEVLRTNLADFFLANRGSSTTSASLGAPPSS